MLKPHRRWLLVLLDVLFLTVLGGYVFAGLEKVPFHGDEATFIHISRDYHTLFYERDWQSIRVRGNLWRTREQYLRTMNGAINPYTIGLAWDLAGYSVDELNGGWRWNDELGHPIDQWVYNLAQGNRPNKGLLAVARLPSALFTVMSIVVLFIITRTLSGSRLAAWIAGLIYATTPAILLNGRRAMQEGSMLWATLLVILVAIHVIRAQERADVTWRRRAAWYLGLGAVSGLAMACKHSSATIIAPAFLTVGVLPWLRMQEDRVFLKRHWYTLAAAVLLMALIMLALLPVWWSPAQFIILAGLIGLALAVGFEIRLAARGALVAVIVVTWIAAPRAGFDLIVTPITIISARSHLMDRQAQNTYHQDTLAARAEMLVDQAFFAGTQYFEDPLWTDFEPITVQIAAYEGAHLDGRGSGAGWGVLLIALDGLGAWWLVAHRRQGTSLLIVGWLAIPVLSLLINPLAWQRYYIVLTAPLALIAGLGVCSLATLFSPRGDSPLTRLLKRPVKVRQGALDHLVIGRQRQAEIPWQFDHGPRQTQDIVRGQNLAKSHIVRQRGAGHQVKCALRLVRVIAHLPQLTQQPITFFLEVFHIDRQFFQVGQRVLEQRVREGIAGEHLRTEDHRAQRFAVRHSRREGDVTQALAGGEQRFTVGVQQKRVGIIGGRAGISAAIVYDPAVRLIGQQIDRATIALAGFGQQRGQRLQCFGRVDLPGRIVGRIDEHGARARRDRGGDGVQIEIEGARLDRRANRHPACR